MAGPVTDDDLLAGAQPQDPGEVMEIVGREDGVGNVVGEHLGRCGGAHRDGGELV
jgi:hypothetical protein